MARLPESLAIALWIVGSTWVLALLALLLDFDREVVWAALLFGLVAGAAEWLARQRR
jgi:hypothetical protein